LLPTVCIDLYKCPRSRQFRSVSGLVRARPVLLCKLFHSVVMWTVFSCYMVCAGGVACNVIRRNVILIRLCWACVEVLLHCRANCARAIPIDSNHSCLNSRVSVNRISLDCQNHRQSRCASVAVSVYL
jgi:hypothetical protein